MAVLFAADRRDWLRLLGGLLFAAGALVLAVRKGSEDVPDMWADVAILFVLLIPFAVLYGLGMLGRATGPDAEPWQATFLVFATLLAPLVLFQFLDTIGGDTESGWNVAWIFALTAALGAPAALLAGATQAGGFGALAGVVAWIAFWDQVLDDPSGDTIRWLLIIIAAVYVLAALAARTHPRAGKVSGLVTAAGIAAVIAALFGNVELIGRAIAGAIGTTVDTGTDAEAGAGWDLFLLAVSVALLAYSARSARRGPGIVGGFGLLVFIIIVGVELSARVEDGEPTGDLVGWPLALLIAGAAGVLISLVLPPGTFGGGKREPAPDAGAPQPGLDPAFTGPPPISQPPPQQQAPPAAPPGQPPPPPPA